MLDDAYGDSGLANASYWSESQETVARRLGMDPKEGLTSGEAELRSKKYGKNVVRAVRIATPVRLLLNQFKTPIVLLLIAAAILSYFLEDAHDAVIILVIVFISAGLGFWQENGATNTIRRLLALVKLKSDVLRDGKEQEIASEDVVPGDIVLLRAGDRVPGDCRLAESKDLFVSEAFLTGESYPAEKTADRVLPQDTPVSQRANCVFMGSYVISGMAKALVASTGAATELGRISSKLKTAKPETDFERGIRQLGYFLAEVTLILIIANFAVNIYLHRSVLDSFLFSLALAIGLTPQLLPAIISVNIAHGARRMGSKHVIIKRLASIENLGSMNILCSDKTGTLTAGVMEMHSAVDLRGNRSDLVLLYAYLNSANETGFVNPVDQAIIRAGKNMGPDTSYFQKLDEIPYDFARKRLSVLLLKKEQGGETALITTTTAVTATASPSEMQDNNLQVMMITKGAVHNILEICSKVEVSPGLICDLDSSHMGMVQNTFNDFSREGFRVLGISYRYLDSSSLHISKEDERESVFLGFLVLSDPIRSDAPESVKSLKCLGISLKIISGDNRLIAGFVGKEVGLNSSSLLTGPELDKMSPDALERRASEVDIFAEVEPRQKEQIILALKKAGNVVGYMGDGINDAPALHAADVGVSVSTATDVVKEEADIVLLEKSLAVLAEGVEEGRRTFANTLKYVFMATSANFGNMFSTATASFFLPFLPMLPKQILLNNLLTDASEMTIASDTIDDTRMLGRPQRWNLGFIQRFMIVFGILSAVFDFATFAILIFVLNAGIEQFRTAWFVESVASASFAILAIRTRKPLLKSRPGKYLLTVSFIVVGTAALLVPFTPIGSVFGIVVLPVLFYIWIAFIVAMYMAAIEFLKRIFFWRTTTRRR
jgi:Mg2+-importing ATPase